MSQRRTSESTRAASTAHNAIAADQMLDAAYDLICSLGPSRMTIADLARRAGVSRATVYRRWPNAEAVVAEVLSREWMRIASTVVPNPEANLRDQLVETTVLIAQATRTNRMWRHVLATDPSYLIHYLLRRGAPSADFQFQLVEFHVRRAMIEGSVRPGDPVLFAQTLLAAAASYVVATIGLDGAPSPLDDEFTELIRRYLTP